MKLLICLAMSCGLTAILYFYLKQKILTIEARLNTLTDLAQTLASEVYHSQKNRTPLENVEPMESSHLSPESDSDSDESDSDDSEDTDSECSDSEDEINEMKTVKLEDLQDFHPVEEFKPVKLEFPNELVIDISEPPLIVTKRDEPIVVSDDEIQEVQEVEEVKEVKQIDVSPDYSNLSLKELKQQVLDLGGPPLKTKQALINFLKKKL